MLTVTNVTKSYGTRIVLDSISFQLSRGITFLMGENGAGKTTLLKAMLGLERHKGIVLYDNRPLHEVADKMAVVFDDSPAYQRLTGYQNIELLCPGGRDRNRVESVARHYLSHDELKRRVYKYSHGQRKRLSLIMALLNEPLYLLMDEVSSGLDYETMEYLKRDLVLRSTSSTIMLTGHQFDFYNPIVDRVLVLKDACISEVDMPERFEVPVNTLGKLYERTIKDVS